MLIALGLLSVAIVSFISGMRFERLPFDSGPWEVLEDKTGIYGVESDDLDCGHVRLFVNGLFENNGDLREYCQWLANTLNKRENDSWTI